jgi:hypothetical protein
MSAAGPQLPMAPTDCTLNESDLAAQLDRYQRLGAAVQHVHQHPDELVVSFQDTIDPALLDETIATERSCCPFFLLDYDASERRLSITVGDPARRDALGALASALTGRRGLPAQPFDQ